LGGGIRQLVSGFSGPGVVEGHTSGLDVTSFGPTENGAGWTVGIEATPHASFVGVRVVATCALMATGG
jgi:hypothetical protein